MKSLRATKRSRKNVRRRVTDTINHDRIILYNINLRANMFLALSNQPSTAFVNSALPSEKANSDPKFDFADQFKGGLDVLKSRAIAENKKVDGNPITPEHSKFGQVWCRHLLSC